MELSQEVSHIAFHIPGESNVADLLTKFHDINVMELSQEVSHIAFPRYVENRELTDRSNRPLNQPCDGCHAVVHIRLQLFFSIMGPAQSNSAISQKNDLKLYVT